MSAQKKTSPAVLSMTGFGSSEGSIGKQKYRIEAKSVNHRFLDLKLRLPREFQSCEAAIRSSVQSRFSRGAVEIKIDRLSENGPSSPLELQLNLDLARSYLEKTRELAEALGLPADSVTLKDVATYPEVIGKNALESSSEESWKGLAPLIEQALDSLLEMRVHEGEALARTLLSSADELEKTISRLRAMRAQIAGKYPERIREKIQAIFESHPLSEANLQAVLESRISQELALLVDRTDVEEELVRFQGHLDHLRKILRAGGQTGRKLDFVLQELNREINTLGNKAQDYGMSEEVVASKVRLEQLREQVMNLE